MAAPSTAPAPPSRTASPARWPSLAYATEVAKNYGITVALHTDHCAKQNIDSWVRPLLEIEAGQVAEGKLPTFQSHMWDGSAIDLDENLEIAKELLALSVKANTILEIEVGAVGGEEDGVVGEINEKLYTTTADAIKTVEALGLGENGRYLTALTFGNVHGAYKPGHVKLRPELLGTIQKEVAEQLRPRPPSLRPGHARRLRLHRPRRSPPLSPTASSR